MITNVKELADRLEHLLEPYEKVAIDGFLTEDGRKLLDCLCDLLDLTPFYDELYDYFQDEKVQKLIKENENYKTIRHLKHFSKRFQ